DRWGRGSFSFTCHFKCEMGYTNAPFKTPTKLPALLIGDIRGPTQEPTRRETRRSDVERCASRLITAGRSIATSCSSSVPLDRHPPFLAKLRLKAHSLSLFSFVRRFLLPRFCLSRSSPPQYNPPTTPPVTSKTTMEAVDGGCGDLGRPATALMPFHLLEITIISAQGLYPATRSINTYASAWVDPKHKLYTRVDRAGHADPTWNDKFIFRVDDAFLRSDTACVDVHLHAARSRLSPLPDHLLGTVRVVLSSLSPAPGVRRFVALLVRRPSSLRPHGILNLSVAILEPHVRSMPLYFGLDSPAAFAYKDITVGRQAKANGRRWSSDDCSGWQLARNGSVSMESGVEEREREELETKLEMWKAEISPDHERDDRSNNSHGGHNRKRSGRLSFFSCAETVESE
ncbi:unnamed protein product, partial [Musa banksii]